MDKLKIGVVGYGNLGRGAVKAVCAAPDMELAAVVTRRDPEKLKIAAPGARALSIDEALAMEGQIDVMLLCGSSANDLREQGPLFAAHFNTVDSFDTHAKIPDYFACVNAAAASTVAVVSCGWDPGLFSLMRLLGGAFLPSGADYTFWGEGVSQGHSAAIRRIPGVTGAVQYSVPVPKALARVREGGQPKLTPRQKHRRVCYVSVEKNADQTQIEREIKEMPDYFADYETEVHFVSAQTLSREHKKMPHGGYVFRNGATGKNRQRMEFSIKLDSNPEFTSSILTACARAAARLAREGKTGATTMLDIPPAYYLPHRAEDLYKTIL